MQARLRVARANSRALRAKIGDRQTEGLTEGRKDGCLEIHPCVLQDIDPLGLLPKKEAKLLRTEAGTIVSESRDNSS